MTKSMDAFPILSRLITDYALLDCFLPPGGRALKFDCQHKSIIHSGTSYLWHSKYYLQTDHKKFFKAQLKTSLFIVKCSIQKHPSNTCWGCFLSTSI